MIYFHGSHNIEFYINRKKSIEKLVKFHFCPKVKYVFFHKTREYLRKLRVRSYFVERLADRSVNKSVELGFEIGLKVLLSKSPLLRKSLLL